MSERGGAVHVVTTRRRYKGRVYATHLLRRSYREEGRVKNETLGNLSHLPESLIDVVRRSLRGETFVPLAARLEILGLDLTRFSGHLMFTKEGDQDDKDTQAICAGVSAPDGTATPGGSGF
jgi:hypothetical protein